MSAADKAASNFEDKEQKPEASVRKRIHVTPPHSFSPTVGKDYRSELHVPVSRIEGRYEINWRTPIGMGGYAIVLEVCLISATANHITGL
jgi:hypothetical protein